MKTLTILGWKSGVDALPLTLLQLLREVLSFDLPRANTLLDEFAERGELTLGRVDDDAAARFEDLARKVGLSVKIAQDMTT